MHVKQKYQLQVDLALHDGCWWVGCPILGPFHHHQRHMIGNGKYLRTFALP